MRRDVLALLAALLFMASTGCELLAPGRPPDGDHAVKVTVTRVVDGDTVEIEPEVDGTEDVRLIGVDTPEMFSPSGEQPYAEEASEFTERRLEGRRVTLRFDTEKEDDYERVLAYLYLSGDSGSMFNETLVREGYAQVATFPPNVRHVERFERAQREARRSRRGIWGLPESELCKLTDRGNRVGGGC